VLAGLALIGLAAPLSAQSLLSSRGLGYPSPALSARATGLGGVGLGLPEPDLSLINPASISGLPAPALLASFQFDRHDTDLGAGASNTGGTARFPLIHAVYPVNPRLSLSIGYGALLDQSWAVDHSGTQVIGADTLAFRDRFTSEGGIGRFRFSSAYGFGSRFAVGAGLDVYTGSTRLAFTRAFEGDFTPSQRMEQWQYSGVGFAAGARYALTEAFSLAAAATVGGTLHAEPGDSLGTSRSFDLPLTLSGGGSARIGQNTLIAASTQWAGWSSMSDALADVGGARDTWGAGGGIEWDAINLRDRRVPLRLGARFQKLPFAWQTSTGAAEWTSERAITGGLGLRLAGGAATIDASLERGSRTSEASAFQESYWRTMLTMRVLGR
jgi:hypothetical protein